LGAVEHGRDVASGHRHPAGRRKPRPAPGAIRQRRGDGTTGQGAGRLRSRWPFQRVDGTALMSGDLYLGYRNDDANTPFATVFNPEMASLPSHVVEALQHGPQGGMALPGFGEAASVADAGYQQTENGYGVLEDGSYQVSVRTDMPGVTPQMWCW